MSAGLEDLPPLRVVRSRLPSLYVLLSLRKGNRGGNYAGSCTSRRGCLVGTSAIDQGKETMATLVSVLQVVHILAAILMVWPFYALRRVTKGFWSRRPRSCSIWPLP